MRVVEFQNIFIFTASIFFLGTNPLLAKCSADITNAKNEIYWINDNNKLVPLETVNSRNGVFRITEDQLGFERKMRFVGHIRSYAYDAPAVLKVSAWSDEKNAQNTEVVLISSDKTLRINGLRPNKIYEIPLNRYQKHHRFGKKYNHTFLSKNFHYGYKDKNGRNQRTDSTISKREKFNFKGVPNTSSPGIFHAILNLIARPVFAANGKYVYLRSILRNLKHSPCFSFSVSLPRLTDRVLFEVLPLDNYNADMFKTNTWRLEK